MISLKKLFTSIVKPRKDLSVILSHAPSVTSPLSKRLEWLADLLHWIMSESPLKTAELDFSTGYPQAIRVKWLLRILDRNPEWKKNFVQLIQSIFPQTSIFDLLVLSGLQRQAGVFSEAMERIEKRILPQAPQHSNMEFFFSSTFKDEKNAYSVLHIDPETFEKVMALVQTSSENLMQAWKVDLDEAISYLSICVAAQGSDPFIRQCLKSRTQKENAFYHLHQQIESWLKEVDTDLALVKKNRASQVLQQAFLQIGQVYTHMEDSGVSVNMVYKLEGISALLKRLQMLIDVRSSLHVPSMAIQDLIASLIFESVHATSVMALLSDNASLIAKKITENSAETGDHYIARTAKEYFAMLRSALGGGVVTAGTTVVKYLVASLPFSPFVLGFFASLNYSVSFLYIQLRHFTLATKQPAMTAAALANQIKEDTTENDLKPLTDEILHLVRSQVLAVCGNVFAVIPTVIAFCALYQWLAGASFLSVEKAVYTVHSFSILGPTPFYAAWTGVLLFTSSLIAGWFYHWVLFNKLPQAIGRSEKLNFLVGASASRRFAVFFKKNAAGFAGNISLGFFLGLVPVFGAFVGLPLDVRHVTLSSGSLTAAVMSMDNNFYESRDFWLAVIGVFSMAVLNLLVSFSLALAVAIRAKKLPAYQVLWVMKSIGRKLLRSPLIWILPPQWLESREKRR